MKKNMGVADRTLRVLIAAIVAGLAYSGVITGTLAVVLLVFSGVFLLTSLIGTCPLYLPFGISTRSKK